jgi:hypothetical protein
MATFSVVSVGNTLVMNNEMPLPFSFIWTNVYLQPHSLLCARTVECSEA